MATRIQFQSSDDIGVFANLTNAYCLVADGGSESFYSAFEQELASKTFPVVHASIAGTRMVGCMSVGNKYGLLLPSTVTPTELTHIRTSLPDSVRVRVVEEKLSALGNVIVCNDNVALVHPHLSKDTVELIKDVLNIEDVFRASIAKEELVGSYCALTDHGALLHPKTSLEEQKELAELLQVPVVAGTVNRGSSKVGAGMVVNNWAAFTGLDTTGIEMAVMERIFQLQDGDEAPMLDHLRSSLIETLK